MTTAAIVQARAGSTRLPGKVLLDLGGKPVLEHVLRRCRAIANVDLVICAVPDNPASQPLEVIAEACGVSVYRGPENDVLQRYQNAVTAFDVDVVLRVTSDCPLIDPDICSKVLRLRDREKADYAANNMPRSFPHGLDCEAFTAEVLKLACEQAHTAYDREHVTPWLRRSDQIRKANLQSEDINLGSYRWTLDFEEDFAFFRAIFAGLADADSAPMAEILAFLAEHPEIQQINAAKKVVS